MNKALLLANWGYRTILALDGAEAVNTMSVTRRTGRG